MNVDPDVGGEGGVEGLADERAGDNILGFQVPCDSEKNLWQVECVRLFCHTGVVLGDLEQRGE